MASPVLNRVILYVRDMPKIAAFYSTHFGFAATVSGPGDKITLQPAEGGCTLVLLQASKGHKIGQSCVKLVFDVPDVAAFRKERARAGLKFGPIHQGPGFCFANVRDPARNLVQISERKP
jgi:predicted enzyme related to lactoylglutathione lyase